MTLKADGNSLLGMELSSAANLAVSVQIGLFAILNSEPHEQRCTCTVMMKQYLWLIFAELHMASGNRQQLMQRRYELLMGLTMQGK